MKSFNLIKLAAISVFGLVAMLGTSQIASAQSNGGYGHSGRTVSRQQGNVDRQRTKTRQQRRTDMNSRNDRDDNGRYYGNDSSYNTYSERHQSDRNRSSYNTNQRRDQDDYNNRYRSGYSNGRSVNIIGAIIRTVRSGSRH